MSYPNVEIRNYTDHNIGGTVEYASIFCTNDTYNASAKGSVNLSRGVCLVTKITAVVNGVSAKPYTSSGTSYSKYFVTQNNDGGFEVQRDTSSEDTPHVPEDYIEPTENQK